MSPTLAWREVPMVYVPRLLLLHEQTDGAAYMARAGMPDLAQALRTEPMMH